MESELEAQLTTCAYIRRKYPDIIFNSDGAGNNVSQVQAGINTQLRSSRGYPDLFIAEPKAEFHGLYIEMKRLGTTLVLKNGQLPADDHFREQWHILARLDKKGYYTAIACGSVEAIDIIDRYLAL